jgi:hypothetical protein
MVVKNNWGPIRAWREYLGLPQAFVASRLAIPQIEYAAQEASRNLDPSSREKIAAVFGIDPRLLQV